MNGAQQQYYVPTQHHLQPQQPQQQSLYHSATRQPSPPYQNYVQQQGPGPQQAQQNYQSYAGQGMNDSRDSGTMSSQGGSYAPVGLIAQVDRNGKHTVTGAPVMGNNGYGAAALEAQESCAPLTGAISHRHP